MTSATMASTVKKVAFILKTVLARGRGAKEQF